MGEPVPRSPLTSGDGMDSAALCEPLSPSSLREALQGLSPTLNLGLLKRFASESPEAAVFLDLLSFAPNPQIKEELLLALAQNPSERVAEALARREDLSREAIAFLARRGGLGVLEGLGENPLLQEHPDLEEEVVEKLALLGRGKLDRLLRHPHLVGTFLRNPPQAQGAEGPEALERFFHEWLSFFEEHPSLAPLGARETRHPDFAQELLRKFGEKVRREIIENRHIPLEFRRGLAKTLEEVLALLPEDPSLALEAERLHRQSPRPLPHALYWNLAGAFPLLTESHRHLLLGEAPPEALLEKVVKAGNLSLEYLVEVLEVLYPRGSHREREVAFRAFLQSLEAGADPALVERAMRLFAEDGEEFRERLLELVAKIPLSAPLLRTLLAFTPEDFRESALEKVSERRDLPEDVIALLVELTPLPRGLVRNRWVPLPKEAQRRALQEGAHSELSEREDLCPEVLLEVLKRLLSSGSHEKARKVARNHPLLPEGIRLFLGAEDPRSILEGLRLGLYARGISPVEMGSAFLRLPKEFRFPGLKEALEARFAEEGFFWEVLGL